MTRVKNGTIHRARRKKIMKRAKGFFGSKHRLYKTAKEQVMKSLTYSYRDRRTKKRDFRKLWIIRINAACRQNEISYSRFINGLAKANVEINRKMLAQIAVDDPTTFANLVKVAKYALEGKVMKEELTAPKKKKVAKVVKEEKKTEEEKKPKAEKIKVEKKPKAEKKPKKEVTTDLSKMTLSDLKEKAKAKKVKGYSTMKKAELLDALK